jgi:hypothetical protein
MVDRRSRLDGEVERLEESCLYTSQAQFETASRKAGRARRWLVLFPGLASAGAGAAVAMGVNPALGVIAALAGVVTAVSSFLGVDRDASAHELAGKTLTALRHEARFLREATAADLTDDAYHAEIKRLSDRYNSYQLSQPTPDPEAFDAARLSIKDRKFEFDADERRKGVPTATIAPLLNAGAQELVAPLKNGDSDR